MKRFMRLPVHENGSTMMEIIVALAVMGAIAIAFLSAMMTAARASYITDTRTMAESLARSQMEYVKNIDYQTGAAFYPANPAISMPVSWVILPTTAEALHNPDDGIQKITVTVQHNDTTVLIVQSYKVDR